MAALLSGGVPPLQNFLHKAANAFHGLCGMGDRHLLEHMPAFGVYLQHGVYFLFRHGFGKVDRIGFQYFVRSHLDQSGRQPFKSANSGERLGSSHSRVLFAPR